MTEKRLLIVDDEPDMSEVVRRVAEDLGYEVQVAVDGREFMRTFDSFNPTVVVLDIVMPGMDGIELVKWLHTRGCSARIFVASAFNLEYAKMAEMLGEAEGLDVKLLKKPFQIAALRAALS